jgi:hypothetical protein
LFAAAPVSLLNESETPCDIVLNAVVAVSAVHPGQAGFPGTICDAANCASGTAMQPLSAKARATARTGKWREKRITWFLGRWAEWLALMPPSTGTREPDVLQRFSLTAAAGKKQHNL